MLNGIKEVLKAMARQTKNNKRTAFEEAVAGVLGDIYKMLSEKNKSYGNSALEPINCFSKGSTLEKLSVRIDDKLNRIKKGSEYPGDDTIMDLIGYLVLYRIASQKEKKK